MQISIEEINRLLAVAPRLSSAHQDQKIQASGKSAFVRGQVTEVQSSPSIQEVRQIKQYVDRLPDARAELVQSLKAQIENGSYQVSGEAIADLIVRRSVADNQV